MNIKDLLRENIRKLKAYSSARDEYQGEAAIFLDANENPYHTGYNRYPDPYQQQLKARISEIKGVPASQMFLGNGSDEAIDLLMRAFCEPYRDNVIVLDPSYGMYQVAADTHGVEVRKVLLNKDFTLDYKAMLKEASKHSKLLFLCSPNNPTGNALSEKGMRKILDKFKGIVVIDEAYIDFCPDKTTIPWLQEYKNLVILQTFSKAWGLAGIRLGMAYANEKIIKVLNKIKMPYNINALTQEYALKALGDTETKDNLVEEILATRMAMNSSLKRVACIKEIYPSDTNFILVKTTNANQIYTYLTDRGVVVRNRHNVSLCRNCLRLTVGTPEENTSLLQALEAYSIDHGASSKKG